jgi:hypothetical protein
MEAESELRGDLLAQSALILDALSAKSFLIRNGNKLASAPDLEAERGSAGIIAKAGSAVMPHGNCKAVLSLLTKRGYIKFVINLIVRKIGVLTALGKIAVYIKRVIRIGRDFDFYILTCIIEIADKINVNILSRKILFPNPF